MSVREHYAEAARFDPAAARALAGPPLPPVARVAWAVFTELDDARPIAVQGIHPITYGEIDAYMRATQTPLTGLDVFLVREIDRAYVGSLAETLTTAEGEPAPSAPAPES